MLTGKKSDVVSDVDCVCVCVCVCKMCLIFMVGNVDENFILERCSTSYYCKLQR